MDQFPLVGGRGRAAIEAALERTRLRAQERHAVAAPAPRVTTFRKDVTDRLGLPADATDEQVFAAVDRALALRAQDAAASAVHPAGWAR